MSHFEHYELNTSDPAAAKKFYSALFGWTFQDVPVAGGTYTLIASKNKPFGGMQRKPMESVPDHWLAFATVDDIDKAIARAQKAGGTMEAGVIEIPGMGKYAVFRDPTGSPFAMWEQLGAPPPAEKKKAAKKKTTAKKKAGKKKTAKKKAGKKKAAKKKAGKKKAGKKKAAKKTAKKPAKKKAGKKKAGKKTAGKKKAAKVKGRRSR